MTAPRPWPPTNQPPDAYWRPHLHLNAWFFLPPAAKAAVLWGVAWSATTALAAINVWRALTEHDDEIGD